MAEADQGRELVLAPNEQAYIQDKTNGNVYLYVGPKQDAIAGSMQPVIFDEKSKSFLRCELQRATQKLTIAPEGWYVVLKNPAKDGKHPDSGGRSAMPALDAGRKVNIQGPCSFAIWPGQMVKVLPGHTLRSNQYLLVRVYDQAAARANWKDATVETTGTSGDVALAGVQAAGLTMGQLIVIKGTEASFFIPPTGLEVVADQHGNLVRDAVTLERLEYCLLLDEAGGKRYVQGPAVVFPNPTEVFKTRMVTPGPNETPRETRKFKAIELTPTSGIHVKVIADYMDGDTKHLVGEELFLTGADTQLYFPREEHAIIKYDEAEVHYATAVPAGEGRYVLDKLSGVVTTYAGPQMLLPDPRNHVILRRVLGLKTCELLYPGNGDALQHNTVLALQQGAEEKTKGAVLDAMYLGVSGSAGMGITAAAMVSNAADARGLGGPAAAGFTGDRMQRKTTYTEPRTLTLDTKYRGAVGVSVWSGYALMLVSKSGQRRVIEGPQSVLLAYDEEPQRLRLSSGKPKTTDRLVETAYLQTQGNIVTDMVEVETSDYCKVLVKLSYRVDFKGEPAKWFAIENYVKHLCDHMRSRLRTAVRGYGIEQFYSASEEIVRSVVLGDEIDGKRAGALFPENGMFVYDADVLGVSITDAEIARLLVGSQRQAMGHALSLAEGKRTLAFTIASEEIKRQQSAEAAKSLAAQCELDKDGIVQRLAVVTAQLAADEQSGAEKAKVLRAEETLKGELSAKQDARTLASAKVVAEAEAARQAVVIEGLKAEVAALVAKAGAISPDLIAAMQAFGDKLVVSELATAMGPLSILGGGRRSVVDIAQALFQGTPLAAHLATLGTKVAATNGDAAKLPPAQPQKQ